MKPAEVYHKRNFSPKTIDRFFTAGYIAYVELKGIRLSKIYKDYYWKNGRPCGIGGDVEPIKIDCQLRYKIVSDPYYKRISVEKYTQKNFEGIAYDSALFDFRKLKPEEQNAWEKTLVSENATKTVCQIRDQDGRLILTEEYVFAENLCKECRSFSPHGILVSVQKIHYAFLGDAFDGAVLYDSNSHPVMYKKYQTDPTTKDFTEIIEERWDMSLPTSVILSS